MGQNSRFLDVNMVQSAEKNTLVQVVQLLSRRFEFHGKLLCDSGGHHLCGSSSARNLVWKGEEKDLTGSAPPY